VDNEQQPRESAFAKACSYLNFNSAARWGAHLAGAGAGVVAVALLSVLWLFADLMVWRGRVPDFHDLTPVQQDRFAKRFDKLGAEDRQKLFADARRPDAASLAATPFDRLSEDEVEAAWRGHAWQVLERLRSDAAEQVFPPDKNGALDRGDNGVLSYVLRESVGVGLPSPVPFLAKTNGWLWKRGNSFLPSYLIVLTLIASLLGLVGIFLVILNRELAAAAVIEATTRLRRAVYHHTFRLGTLAVRAMGPSEAVSLLTRHVEAVHDALYARLTTWFREPIFIGLLLLFALFLDPVISVAFVLFAVIIWLLGVRLIAYFRNQGAVASHAAAERLTIIRESLMLMRLVKSFTMEPFNQARIERQLARYGQVQKVRHRADALGSPLLLLMAGLAGIVLLFVGALGVLKGYLSVAGAVTLVATLLCLYRPVQRWLEGWKLVKRGRGAADQIFQFLERRGEVGQVVGAEFLPPLSRQIEFDNVSLKEPGTGRMLLENVSLSVQAGQKIGLCGIDDLEKHALVYLIPRLLDPTAGEIRVDQHNLRWVTLDSLRAQVAIVMMQNLVFHDSVRNNIGCGDNSYTLPQIIEAAKMAHAHHFIQKLPQGYETPIGELGQSLSLTQQYRIALARAILRDPALLILEEPDVELDDDSKNLLDDTLARIVPGRTVIFLPHRISTLRSCNTIHLLNKGQLAASGTHKELLKSSKLYRHLYYLEFNEMDEQV
jgi:ATP-binding cassette, subfamily B, bacterial